MLAEWPAERVLARVGDIVLRDMRLRHGGMRNRTAEHHAPIAIMYRQNTTSGSMTIRCLCRVMLSRSFSRRKSGASRGQSNYLVESLRTRDGREVFL